MNAILLAGGKSSRFGENNKALTEINGQPMLIHIISRLQQVFQTTYVIGDKKEYSFLREEYSQIEIKEDIIPEKGPLGGLYTGLKYSDTSYNCLVGCDMPLLTVSYYRFLKKYSRENHISEALVPRYESQLEPLAAIYTSRCLPVLSNFINNDKLRFQIFLKKIDLTVISDKKLKQKFKQPEQLFYNINYKKDLARIRNDL